MTTGQLDVLACGAGDIKITFDDANPLEVERAKRIIKDMLKRGYSLFVHGADNALIRVKKFDEKKGVYLIADGPTVPPEAEDSPSDSKPWRKMKAMPIGKAKATVVGRSAGG